MDRTLQHSLKMLLLLACLGCEDIYGPSLHPPAIFNLRYTPTSIRLNENAGSAEVTWSVDFSDEGADITHFRLTTSTGIDTVGRAWHRGSSLGVHSGTFNVPTSAVTTHQFSVVLVDSAGSASNKLIGMVDVKIFDEGITWTEQASGTSAGLNRVAWTKGGFVAVGTNGAILTSSRGASWAAKNANTNASLWGIATSSTTIVVVGERGTTIQWELDGPSFSTNTANAQTDLYDVCCSGSLFCAVGASRTDSSAAIFTSVDGANWTEAQGDSIPGVLRRILWTGSQFLAIGSERSALRRDLVALSADGLTWQYKPLPGSGGLRDMVWTGNYLVAICADGTAMNSTDFSGWTTSQSGATQLSGIAWSGSTFIAVGNAVYSSPNGVTWTKIGYYGGFQSAAWSGLQYVIVGGGGKIFTSP